MSTVLTVILAIIVLGIIWIVYAFNRFVILTNRAKEALSDIDVQLKRRYDLIPNLVETVKGYAKHETSAFENVTKARAAAMGATAPAEKLAAENQLTSTLKSLFAVAEAYPELKANASFLELQRELSDTEDKIQASRRFYNSTVQELNTKLEQFPGNIIGPAFHFTSRDFFELSAGDAAAKEPIKVQF
ncbi:MAG: LemA family protein [bacterium]